MGVSGGKNWTVSFRLPCGWGFFTFRRSCSASLGQFHRSAGRIFLNLLKRYDYKIGAFQGAAGVWLMFPGGVCHGFVVFFFSLDDSSFGTHWRKNDDCIHIYLIYSSLLKISQEIGIYC